MNQLEDLVARALERKGMNLQGLADALGTTAETLENTFEHPGSLDLEDSMALASVLGLTLDEIGRASLESDKPLYEALIARRHEADADGDEDAAEERAGDKD